jgi:hypothetical protein
MKLLSKIANWSLAVLIVVNIAGAVFYFVQQRQMRQATPEPMLSDGSKFPAFSGIDLQGAKWTAGDAPCRVIRIADDRCTFCKRDKPSYEKFVNAARRASCEIIEIAPMANGMAYDPRPGIVQLKFVDADVGAVLFPFVTPQTIILGKDWSVKMNRRGIFTEESLANSVVLLDTFKPSLAAR